MRAVEYWRDRHRNLRLQGYKRPTPEGGEEFSINGFSWFEPSPNSHHEGEDPLEGKIIYQAQASPGDNSREPIKIRGVVKIPVSSG